MEAVFSIPVAMGLGYWADSRFGTEPIFLLAGVVLGFAAFVLRLVRMRHDIEGQGEE
jgi:F0F1-type ATP synthase assembly protein I